MDDGRIDSLFMFTEKLVGFTRTIVVESSLMEEKRDLEEFGEVNSCKVMILLLSKPKLLSNKPNLIFFYPGCVTEGVRIIVALLGQTMNKTSL